MKSFYDNITIKEKLMDALWALILKLFLEFL